MSEDDKGNMMAVVMLGDINLPDNEALRRSINVRFTNISIPTDTSAGGDAPFLFFTQGAICAIMRLPAPCPIAPQDPCFTLAWYWPKAWEELKDHKTHMVVAVSGGSDARTRAILLSQLTAAVVEASPSSIGVHCASSKALWPAQAVPAMTQPDGNTEATPLLIAVRLVHDHTKISGKHFSGVSAITHGLSTFGLMEIEALDIPEDPRTLTATILDLASYLISAGPVINDGDTIGPDETTKLTVRHETSHWAPDQKVYRVQLGCPVSKQN